VRAPPAFVGPPPDSIDTSSCDVLRPLASSCFRPAGSAAPSAALRQREPLAVPRSILTRHRLLQLLCFFSLLLLSRETWCLVLLRLLALFVHGRPAHDARTAVTRPCPPPPLPVSTPYSCCRRRSTPVPSCVLPSPGQFISPSTPVSRPLLLPSAPGCVFPIIWLSVLPHHIASPPVPPLPLPRPPLILGWTLGSTGHDLDHGHSTHVSLFSVSLGQDLVLFFPSSSSPPLLHMTQHIQHVSNAKR
jgi:hypothetical protein